MSEKENLCVDCENNCCKNFKLYWTADEVNKLIEQYPFFHIVATDVGFVNGKEKVYRVMVCDRLTSDGSCIDYPKNRPPFCENTGIKTRPAINCKLHDLMGK